MNSRFALALLLVCGVALTFLTGGASPTGCDTPAGENRLPEDTACRGPFEVVWAEYDSRSAYPEGIMIEGVDVPVDVWGLVAYPAEFPQETAPLVLVLHGNEGENACSNEGQPCHHHEGFAYLIDHLASHGFIAVSVNAARLAGNFDRVLERAHLLLAHVDAWRAINAGVHPQLGTLLKDRVDLNNIGLVGHSRGGEAVVAAYGLNESLDDPFSIGAVMSIAPTDKQGLSILNVPHYALVPACDGDVLDSRGVRFFDRAFDAPESSPSSKQVAYALGANHNFFNSFWARDGGGCLGVQLLDRQPQERLAQQLATAFFRTHLMGESALQYVFTGDVRGPATPDIPMWLSYLDPTHVTIDSFSDALTQNALGGQSTFSGFEQAHLCGNTGPACSVALTNEVDALALRWQQPSRYETEIPVDFQDASAFSHLSLRVTQNPEDSVVDALDPAGKPLHFEIELSDAHGVSAAVLTLNYGGAPFPIGSTVRSEQSGRSIRRAVLRTLRIPLAEFIGIDFTKIARITLKFEQPGSIYLTGLQWTR